jgi:hypothetical protein
MGFLLKQIGKLKKELESLSNNPNIVQENRFIPISEIENIINQNLNEDNLKALIKEVVSNQDLKK